MPDTKRADMIVHEQEPYNAEPPRSALLDDLVTPVETFYSRNHGPVPQLDAGSWRLVVDGLVREPLSLSLDDLRTAFPERGVTATLQCAGARRADLLAVRDIPGEAPWGPGATSTARWSGVSLADVLARSGPATGAAHVGLEAPDRSPDLDQEVGYGGSIPLAKALSPEVLLAWAMNGQPLTPLHGAPVRVVVPGWIGARSVKWVQRVHVSAETSTNYYQDKAYRLLPVEADPTELVAGAGFALGPVALNCDLLSPPDGARVVAGTTTLRGYAYAGDDRSVVRVDVSTDGGRTWRQAALQQDDHGPWAWCHWRLDVALSAGRTEVVVRAWDSTGALQPRSPQDVWNPKGYVNNSWARAGLTVL